MQANKLEQKQITAAPNIMVFAVMCYYFVIGRQILQPYVLAPIYRLLGRYPLHGFAGIFNAFFRDFGIPVLIYMAYLVIKKRDMRAMFSLSRLRLTAVLDIAVMTLAVRVVFNLIEAGVPFFAHGNVPMQTFRFMDILPSLIHNAILATLFEEVLFRGVLWGEYRRHGVKYWKTAVVTGLFFGVIHLGQFSILHTAFSGVFFYAPLIYFTRSIWAPVLHHALMNGLYTLTNPVFYINNQADFNAFMPTYLAILAFATLVLIPLAILCGKRFYQEHRHNVPKEENPPSESVSFHVSYWVLIGIFLLTFLRA